MKNNILNLLKHLYHFLIIALIVLYLFPGSLIGYFLYGNLGQQPDFISNPIGTSINHLLYFFLLSILASILRSKAKNLFNNFYLIFFLSIILELLQIIIPNRAFEYYDLLANILGVCAGSVTYRILTWIKFL